MSGGGRDLLAVRNLGSSAIQDLVAVDGLEKIPLLLCQMAGWVAGSKWVRVVLGVGLGCRQEGRRQRRRCLSTMKNRLKWRLCRE